MFFGMCLVAADNVHGPSDGPQQVPVFPVDPIQSIYYGTPKTNDVVAPSPSYNYYNGMFNPGPITQFEDPIPEPQNPSANSIGPVIKVSKGKKFTFLKILVKKCYKMNGKLFENVEHVVLEKKFKNFEFWHILPHP